MNNAAKHVRESVEETLRYMSYPEEHWRKIRTNNPPERIIREIRRRTRVVGSLPDGRHIAGTKWGTRRHLSLERLYEPELGRKVA